MRQIDFIADEEGDWAFHRHKSHHTMDAMQHSCDVDRQRAFRCRRHGRHNQTQTRADGTSSMPPLAKPATATEVLRKPGAGAAGGHSGHGKH